MIGLTGELQPSARSVHNSCRRVVQFPPPSRSGLLANFYRKQCRAKTGRGQFLLQGFGIAGRHRLLDAALEITRPAFEVTLDVFQYAGLITKRHKYEDVIARPPA